MGAGEGGEAVAKEGEREGRRRGLWMDKSLDLYEYTPLPRAEIVTVQSCSVKSRNASLASP